MFHKTVTPPRVLILLLLAGLFLFSSCAPKIYGQTKKKKKKCGCELILPEQKYNGYGLC